ncbi:MAG TPA: VOC family protein [Acidimicrobiales bacterium]|nr:VOC family protein [Acidimicrobiales bacterium]
MVDPILHLSLPVHDLVEARRFYLEVLGCAPGRERPDGCDVWFYGMQLTLQERPDQVLSDEQRGVRHFGVTLTGDELDDLLQRVGEHPVRWLVPITIDYAGTPREQRKAKILDPSGNAIEIKAYPDRRAAFAALDLPPG